MGRKVDVDNLIDTQDVARLLGLSHRNTVSEYQAKYEDMPRPVIDLGRGRSRLWLRSEIERWYAGPGQECRDARLLTTRANGGPAVAVYHPTGHDRWEPFAIHLLEIRDDRLGGIMQFIDASLFAQFDLPAAISSDRRPV